MLNDDVSSHMLLKHPNYSDSANERPVSSSEADFLQQNGDLIEFAPQPLKTAINADPFLAREPNILIHRLKIPWF